MSKTKVQMSVRWPRQLYNLAVTVAISLKRPVGWVLIDWAEKGAKADGFPVPEFAPDDDVEDGR